MTSFTVAVDRDFTEKGSNERETDFIDCVAWRQTGEFVAKYFKKGAMIIVFWDFSPTWTELFKTRDYHAALAETSLLLHWCPEVVRQDMVQTDVEEVAERLRSDPDSYQLRESFTELSQEVVQTSQRDDVIVGVMGYPEQASAELGAKIEAEFISNASAALRKAITDADDARKSGKRIMHDNGEALKILNQL